jgi:hypothetical protein
VDDRVEAGEVCSGHVAHVSAQRFDGVALVPQVAPLVEERVEADDVVACAHELWNGDGADVAVVAGDEDFHGRETSRSQRTDGPRNGAANDRTALPATVPSCRSRGLRTSIQRTRNRPGAPRKSTVKRPARGCSTTYSRPGEASA